MESISDPAPALSALIRPDRNPKKAEKSVDESSSILAEALKSESSRRFRSVAFPPLCASSHWIVERTRAPTPRGRPPYRVYLINNVMHAPSADAPTRRCKPKRFVPRTLSVDN
jgi:hypothetical protein